MLSALFMVPRLSPLLRQDKSNLGCSMANDLSHCAGLSPSSLERNEGGEREREGVDRALLSFQQRKIFP